VRLSAGAAVKPTAYTPPAPAKSAPQTSQALQKAPSSLVSIHFATGQATLDTGAMRAIRTATAAYIGIGTQINVTGYADKTGNAAANVELAKKRAIAVRDDLVKLGVEPRRVQLTPPVSVTGAGSDDQARRVDISVTH